MQIILGGQYGTVLRMIPVTPPSKVDLRMVWGERGIQGPAGTAGNTFSIVAVENITAFAPVTSGGQVADSNNILHYGKYLGLAIAGINSSFSGLIQSFGVLTNSGWSWISGDKIYIVGKILTNVPPTGANSKWSLCIGTAITATEILLDSEDIILL